ncbi:hypothetical protein [Micromonospora rubida]
MPITDPALAQEMRHWRAVKAGAISAAKKTRAEHRAAMEKAREAQRANLAREIDPDGTLAAADPDELDRQVDLLRRARLADASLKGVMARAALREQRQRTDVGAA